jgi:hypothetical protein
VRNTLNQKFDRCCFFVYNKKTFTHNPISMNSILKVDKDNYLNKGEEKLSIDTIGDVIAQDIFL